MMDENLYHLTLVDQKKKYLVTPGPKYPDTKVAPAGHATDNVDVEWSSVPQ